LPEFSDQTPSEQMIQEDVKTSDEDLNNFLHPN
jgi:hypothetical protein